MRAAAELGSDIPFCLLGCYSPADKSLLSGPEGATAIARGRGEILEPLRGRHLPWTTAGCLIMRYQQPRYIRVCAWMRSGKGRYRSFLAAWQDCDIMNIAKNLVNVLESVSIRLYPEIATIKAAMIEHGALNALMSGSGPTVSAFSLRSNRAEQADRAFSSIINKCFGIVIWQGEKSAGTKIMPVNLDSYKPLRIVLKLSGKP